MLRSWWKIFLAAIPVFILLLLAGCGGSSSTSIGGNVNGQTGTTADFSLVATPANVTVTSGSTGSSISVAATASGGFSSPITVTLSGLPTGVSANPATFSLNPGSTEAILLTAASGTAAVSNGTLTATGAAGSLSHTATAALAVVAAAAPPPSADFSLTLAPTALTLQDTGSAQSFTVTANALNGFTGTVAVATGTLPAGITATPSTLTLAPGVPQTISLLATTATPGAASVTLDATSGSLSHSASLPLSITAALVPGFTISVAPTAQTLTIGNATGAEVAVSAAPVNGFTDPVAITLTGLPAGVTANPATLTLTPGVAQSVTLVAGFSAVAGTTTVTFNGADGAIASSANLALTTQAYAVPDVATYHYDNTRDGLNAQETILTPANVSAATFGKTGFYAVDGKVDAAPLFAAQVKPQGGTTTNIVYIATEHDSLYAFDTATGLQVWKATVLGNKETTARNGCAQISPQVGITSTPVIDRAAGPNGTIFVIGMSVDAAGAYHQRLHALDLATGAEQAGSPSEITASYPGTGDNSSNGNVIFDPAQYAERVGLLLLNGTIYTAWTSHCDIRPYTGWVMGFSESTLQQTQVLNLTPNGSEGAVWMSGGGLAADSTGNIYLLDANGSFQDTFNAFGFPSDGDYGNGILKLSTNGVLGVSDFFEIYNSDAESNVDADIGAGGLLLLPDQVDASGNTRHLLVGAGKDTNIYVADRDNLGKFNIATPDNTNVYQELPAALARGAWSSPAYFNQTVYYAGQGDTLKAFPVSKALLSATPSSQSTTTFAYPGSTPSVSSNGATNGIVWALESSTATAGVLHAYDATNLSKELYNSNQLLPNGSSSTFGNGNKFITPVVVNGNVYVGTQNGVAVFGLLPQ